MNVLDYESEKKLKGFSDLDFQRDVILTIEKPTRVGKNSTTATDHIKTDCVIT